MKYVLFIHLLAFIFFGCGKEYSCEKCLPVKIYDTVVTPVLDTSLTDSTLFFDIIIDGRRYFKVSGRDSWGFFYVGSQSGIEADSGYLSAFRWPLVKISRDSSASYRNQLFLAQYAVGVCPFTTQLSQTSGIILKWKDAKGVLWGTDEGTAVQTNNSFSIISAKPEIYPPTGVILSIITYCTFTCTMYDNNGNSMKLTNGKLRYGFWN